MSNVRGIERQIEGARDAEVQIERPDGSQITVIVNIRPLKNERGEVTGAINCCYNITERKRAEAALRDSQSRFEALFETPHRSACTWSTRNCAFGW